MLKQISLFLVLCFCTAGLFAEEQKKDTMNAYAKVTVSKNAEATECYVLLEIVQTDMTYENAMKEIEAIQKKFTERFQKEFPKGKLKIAFSKIGTNPASRMQNENELPQIQKIYLCTIEPDEDQAAKLLDLGREAGLTPFCGYSRAGETGAVFYGLQDISGVCDTLYPEAVAKWKAEIQAQSDAAGRKITRVFINKELERDMFTPGEITARDIRLVLPANLYSADKHRIPVSLTLTGHAVLEKKETTAK